MADADDVGTPRDFRSLELAEEAISGTETEEALRGTAGDQLAKSSSLVTELDDALRADVVLAFLESDVELGEAVREGEAEEGAVEAVGNVFSEVLTANCAGLSLWGSFLAVPGILKYLR